MVLKALRTFKENLSSKGRKQLFWDIPRGLFQGLQASYVMYVFGILVANERFGCSSNQKTMIVGGLFVGMMANIPFESLIHRFVSTRNAQAAICSTLYAVGALYTSFASTGAQFTLGCCIMGAVGSLSLPAVISIWRENYPTHLRGQASSISLWITSGTSIVAALLGGLWLDSSIENFRPFFVLLSIAGLADTLCVLRMPLVDLPSYKCTPRQNPLRILKENPIFAQILVAWFLTGLGMHLVLVQKTEYLSNPTYGLGLSKATVAFLAAGLTDGAMLISMPFFARAFDRLNFLSVRIIVNSLFFVFIAMYFNTSAILLIGLASAIHGIGKGGGALTWKLWVTKYAKSDQTGSFMAIHTFLTGVRGILGPWLSYQFVEAYSVGQTSWISLCLSIVAIMILVRLRLTSPHPTSSD